MKAYVGTTNHIKIQAVKNVLEPLGINVIGVDVSSFVSDQPKNDTETVKGAYNRAIQLPMDGLRIGLEAGVSEAGSDLYLINYGVLIDPEGNIYKAGGTRLVLPPEIKDAIFKDGLELSDAMTKYFGTIDIKHHEGAIGYFTNNMVKRVDIFEHITKILYGLYLHGGLK